MNLKGLLKMEKQNIVLKILYGKTFPYCDFNCKYDCFTVIGILFSFIFVDHLTEK